jgi:beta-glucosidase
MRIITIFIIYKPLFMIRIYFFLIILLTVMDIICQDSVYPFQDPDNTIDNRIEDLLNRLTIDEKASLLLYNSPSIERLNIQEYNWWNESLHGVGRAGKATVFPQAIGLAATFDTGLIYKVASAISDEARGKHNEAIKKGIRGQYTGLTFWTPNVNIFRDPRWGRGQETYGEDPYLTSMIGKAFVGGLQGSDANMLKAAACAKHYVVHSGPEESRHRFNAVPTETDFYETYLPAFRELVNSDVEAVMCAYNRTWGEPCCGSPFLLNDVLRDKLGFGGHVVSDCWALDDIWLRHKYLETEVEAAALAVKSGVNLNCGSIYKYIPEAISKNMISESDLNNALVPVLQTKFKLGLFDPPLSHPYMKITGEVVNCDRHVRLALESAEKSIVLLKNNGALPLADDSLKGIFVTGPLAADMMSLVGNYNGYSGNMVTFLEGIVERAGTGIPVDYLTGYLLDNDSLFNGFWQSHFADVIIAVLGNNRLLEGENGDALLNENGGDRLTIEFPENQLEFLRKLRKEAGLKPIITIVTGGSALAMSEVIELSDAILLAWYPGEQGGNAIANILFGDVSPSGRLPVTFYNSTSDLPEFDNYSMASRTYRFFKNKPEFAFGYGLSYTTFEYSNSFISIENDNIVVGTSIKNTGKYDGDEIVQIYAVLPEIGNSDPIKTLVGFKRVSIPEGQSLDIEIPVNIDFCKRWIIEKQEYELVPGKYLFQVGASSDDVRGEVEIIK